MYGRLPKGPCFVVSLSVKAKLPGKRYEIRRYPLANHAGGYQQFDDYGSAKAAAEKRRKSGGYDSYSVIYCAD